jgi:uncharacterized membrane protein
MENKTKKMRPRIQALSDLIFGLALSISALILIAQQPATNEQLFASLGLYSFSFLVLIGIWQSYSSVTSILPSETAGLTDLNVLLLFGVSVEPYLFNELFSVKGSISSTVSGVYSIDLAAMFLILAFFNQPLAKEEKKIVSENLLSRYKLARNIYLVNVAILAISTAPIFGMTVFHYSAPEISYDFTLRGALWIAALVVGYSKRLFDYHLYSGAKTDALTVSNSRNLLKGGEKQ